VSLRSRLFRGDAALEACLVRDPAHVLLGARGDHVGKIQSALAILDHAQIDQLEWSAKQYDRSTAAAVLAYKKKRRIINFSYQTQADDIVGKMTIAALDEEMVAFEQRSLRLPPWCGDPATHAGGGFKAALVASGGVQASPVGSAPPFSVNLRIIWQPTAAAVKQAQHRHLVMIPEANKILRPLGMEITSPLSFPDTTVPNDRTVNPGSGADILNVRQDADKQRPGFANVLRVIPCPMFRTDPKTFALTDGGKVASIAELGDFPDFGLINVGESRPDQLTLLHEMIHAATGLTWRAHDSDPASVFAESDHRSVLRPSHAEALSKAFFAGPKSPGRAAAVLEDPVAEHHQLPHARADRLHSRLAGGDQAVEEPPEQGVEPHGRPGRQEHRLAEARVARLAQPGLPADRRAAGELPSGEPAKPGERTAPWVKRAEAEPVAAPDPAT
jgi:hypothetical protein